MWLCYQCTCMELLVCLLCQPASAFRHWAIPTSARFLFRNLFMERLHYKISTVYSDYTLSCTIRRPWLFPHALDAFFTHRFRCPFPFSFSVLVYIELIVCSHITFSFYASRRFEFVESALKMFLFFAVIAMLLGTAHYQRKVKSNLQYKASSQVPAVKDHTVQ